MVSRHSFNLPKMAGSSTVKKNIGMHYKSYFLVYLKPLVVATLTGLSAVMIRLIQHVC